MLFLVIFKLTDKIPMNAPPTRVGFPKKRPPLGGAFKREGRSCKKKSILGGAFKSERAFIGENTVPHKL